MLSTHVVDNGIELVELIMTSVGMSLSVPRQLVELGFGLLEVLRDLCMVLLLDLDLVLELLLFTEDWTGIQGRTIIMYQLTLI